MKLKKTDIVLLSLISLAALAGGLYLYFSRKDITPTIGVGNSNTNTTNKNPLDTTVPAPTQPSGFPLKKGSRGSEVKTLQKSLNDWLAFYWFSLGNTRPTDNKGKLIEQLVTDGIWGDKTESVVKARFGTNVVTHENYIKLNANPTA